MIRILCGVLRGPFFTISFIAAFILPANSQSSDNTKKHKSYTIENGLPSNLVYDLIQDRKGYMWFATENGVSRFDGKRFWNYDIHDGLTDLEIIRLFEDSKGRIWFLTLNGTASFWFNDRIYNENNFSYLSDIKVKSGIQSMAEDKYGNLWLGGVGGVYAMIDTNNVVTSSISDLTGVSFVSERNGEIIMASKFRLASYISGKFIQFETLPTCSNIALATMNEAAKFPMFLACDGFYTLDEHKKKRLLIPGKTFPLENCTRVYSIDIDGNIYLQCTDGGMLFIEYSNGTFLPYKHILQEHKINRAFKDDGGNIWFATVSDGLLMLPNSSVNNALKLSTEPQLQGAIVSLLPKNDEGLFIRTKTGSVGFFDGINYESIYQIKSGIASGSSAMLWNNEELLWSGGEGVMSWKNGVFEMHYSYSKKTPTQKIMSAYRELIANSKGEVFASYFGLAMLNQKDGLFHSYLPELIPAERIIHPMFDSNNHLWFESGNELFEVVSDNELKSFKELSVFFGGKITGIKELSDHHLLIATYGNGLHILHEGKIVHSFNKVDGLLSDLCRYVYVKNDTLLVTGDKGLSILSYEAGKLRMICSLNVDDGLPSNEIICASMCQGKYFIGTKAGLFSIPVSYQVNRNDVPRLCLNSLLNSSNEFLNASGFILKGKDANVTMDFSAIEFASPNSVVYRYRLKANDHWTESKTSEFRFANLQADSYQFEIQAKKHNSNWSASITIPFIVELPWFKRFWVLTVFVILLAALIIWMFARYYMKRNERAGRELLRRDSITQERLRIASDVHDDLGAELSNLLLESRIEAINPEISHEERKRLLNIEISVQKALEKVDEIIWSLDPKGDYLDDFQEHIRKYFERFLIVSGLKGAFSYASDKELVHLSSGQRRNLFMCIKEILHNAQKHSMATVANMGMTYIEGRLVITIWDDGKGISEENRQFAIGGQGLKNIKRRMLDLNGEFVITPLDPGLRQELILQVIQL
ncbi:MAG: two-component regulator propeller domain-containing protein [Flavobacteriales bacterium]